MSCTRISCIFLLVLIVTALSSSTYCQAPHSSFTIHLGKTGLFSAVGHNHVVVAPIAHGSIDAKAMAVEILGEERHSRNPVHQCVLEQIRSQTGGGLRRLDRQPTPVPQQRADLPVARHP